MESLDFDKNTFDQTNLDEVFSFFSLIALNSHEIAVGMTPRVLLDSSLPIMV